MAVCKETVVDIEDFAILAASKGVNVMFQFPCEEDAIITKEILHGVVTALKMKYLLSDYITIKILHSPLQARHMEIVEYLCDSWDKERESFFENSKLYPRKAKNKNILLYEDIQKEVNNNFTCRMPWDGLFIDSLGYVYPCSNMSGYILGNLYYDDISNILSSKKRVCLQQEVLAGKYTSCWEKCNSNYAPNTSIMNGNNYISPYQELFNEQKYKEAISFYNMIEETPLMGAIDFYQYAYCLHVTDTNIPKAIELYSDAYKRGFSKFWICYNRADAYIRINELDKGREDIREAYELDPDHGGIKMMYEKYILAE